MRIRINLIISIALFIVFYTGFQGGRYYLANRVQEIGLLFSIILFFYSAFIANFNVRDKDLKWNWWFFSTLFFIAYTFILPAYVFSINQDVAVLPSIMASREFLIAFIGPAIYFLYRIGYDIETIEKVFIIALVALALNYLFHYFRMDLRAAFYSSDHTVSGLVTYDPWRGYRLKPSSIALFILSILTPLLIFQSKRITKKILWFVMFMILGYIWFLVQARSMAASLILTLLMYPFFFSKKSRLSLLFFALPFIVLGFVSLTTYLIDHMASNGPNDAVRLRSFSIAWDSIKQNPFLGFGQQSNFTKTEQEILWYKFYSADIGILGVTFKYGFIGMLTYVFFSFFLVQRLIRTLWLYKSAYGQINPLMFSIMILLLTFLINMILHTSMIFIQGLTIASFAIGLSSAWLHKIRSDLSNKSPT